MINFGVTDPTSGEVTFLQLEQAFGEKILMGLADAAIQQQRAFVERPSKQLYEDARAGARDTLALMEERRNLGGLGLFNNSGFMPVSVAENWEPAAPGNSADTEALYNQYIGAKARPELQFTDLPEKQQRKIMKRDGIISEAVAAWHGITSYVRKTSGRILAASGAATSPVEHARMSSRILRLV